MSKLNRFSVDFESGEQYPDLDGDYISAEDALKLEAENIALKGCLGQIAGATIDLPNVVAEDFQALARETIKDLTDGNKQN